MLKWSKWQRWHQMKTIPWRQIAACIEFIAIVLGVLAIVYEFRVQKPTDRELRNAQLHASVAELAANENIDTTEHAVHKVLALMYHEGVDMTGISFPGVTLRMANFETSNWSDAYMKDVEFACTDRMYDLINDYDEQEGTSKLKLCINLRDANFSGAYMRNTRFSYADLFDSDFTRAALDESRIADSVFAESQFADADMSGITISSSDFSGSKFGRFLKLDCRFGKRTQCVELKHVDFSRVEMPVASFEGAELDNVDFAGSDLRGARFGCDELRGEESCTTIESVCLHGTNLTQSRLEDITVSNTDFSRTQIANASFKNVTFDNVVFTDDQIKQIKFDDSSRRSLNQARVSTLGLPEDETPCTLAWRQHINEWKASFAL